MNSNEHNSLYILFFCKLLQFDSKHFANSTSLQRDDCEQFNCDKNSIFSRFNDFFGDFFLSKKQKA